MKVIEIQVDDQTIPVFCFPNRPKALLDRVVAEIYGVPTKQVNRAVKRNQDRFPSDFYFDLTTDELRCLKIYATEHFVQNEGEDHLPHYNDNVDSNLQEVPKRYFSFTKGHPPKAFTHYGCNMISTLLKSPLAIRRSVQIIRAFSALEAEEEAQLARDQPEQLLLSEIKKSLRYELNQAIRPPSEDALYLMPSLLAKIRALETRLDVSEREVQELRERMRDIKSSGGANLIIPALTEEVYRNRADLRQLQGQMALVQDKFTQMKLPFYDSPKKTPARITKKELKQLKTLAVQKAPSRRALMALWSELKRTFGISRYIHLPRNKFKAAMEWIKKLPNPQGV